MDHVKSNSKQFIFIIVIFLLKGKSWNYNNESFLLFLQKGIAVIVVFYNFNDIGKQARLYSAYAFMYRQSRQR